MKNAADPERVTRELSEISNALTDAIDEVREIAHNLRPYQLDRLGLTQALRSLAAKMSESSAVKFSTDIENIDELFTAETSTHRIPYRAGIREQYSQALGRFGGLHCRETEPVGRSTSSCGTMAGDSGMIRSMPSQTLRFRPQRHRTTCEDAGRDLDR